MTFSAIRSSASYSSRTTGRPPVLSRVVPSNVTTAPLNARRTASAVEPTSISSVPTHTSTPPLTGG